MEISPFLLTTVHLTLLLFAFSAAYTNFTDLSALQAFKASVGDPYRLLSAGWTANTSFCAWTGVSCGRTGQRVVALHIENLPLYGTISPHIGNLSLLSYLNLTNTSLGGPVPDSLSRLPRLSILSLVMNRLSGPIPPSIFNMTSLTELHLRYNDLSGCVPSNLSLPSMQALSLSANWLSGSIPSGLSRCIHLRSLSLAANEFSGSIPAEIGNLQQLRHLAIGANHLTGTIPIPLGNLTNMRLFGVGDNRIHGTIPDEFGGLSNLVILLAAGNLGINGQVPISLSNMSRIEVLDLTYNQLTGPLRLRFEDMPSLRTLFLGGNRLTGAMDFLAPLSNCRVLGAVELGGNELDGFLPDDIGNLSGRLRSFAANSNRLRGRIPASVGNLSGLWDLDLGNNELVGTIPSEISVLQNLQSLILDNNRIRGSIPQEFGRLRRLSKLSLDGNVLSGHIPDSLGNISGLQRLTMSANALSAGIPESIWGLTGLIELNLGRNLLEGSLSMDVGSIKSLDTLDMSMNRLSGNIPISLGGLQMVRYMDLSNNSFDGAIPPSFGELISIEALNLSCNNLEGVIPNSLAKLRYLKSINLSFNKLVGEVPDGGVFSNITTASLAGNVALCGAPTLGFPPCRTHDPASSSRTRAGYVLAAIVFALIFAAFCCILLIPFRTQTNHDPVPQNKEYPYSHRLISYHELVRATGGFSEANLLGRGSFGSVYKGCLDDGLVAAIKVMNLDIVGASTSFDVECRALRMVRHKNLVKIINTCSNLDFKALILQFMPEGNLERWLYSHNYCLNLLQRINIAIDVASALEYLHHHHTQVVLHCDLKPSNILLNEDMTACLSDFGIAKLLSGDGQSFTSTSAQGTIGYMAPEYASKGRASTKGDVYSFGILLLELFTRKKPTDPMFVGELSLRRWVSESHPAALLEIVDGNLLNDESGHERRAEDLISLHACLSSVMELGMICSMASPKARLAMKEVVPMLHNIKKDYLAVFPVV